VETLARAVATVDEQGGPVSVTVVAGVGVAGTAGRTGGRRAFASVAAAAVEIAVAATAVVAAAVAVAVTAAGSAVAAAAVATAFVAAAGVAASVFAVAAADAVGAVDAGSVGGMQRGYFVVGPSSSCFGWEVVRVPVLVIVGVLLVEKEF
jgi:hypothetical protein